MSQATTRQPEPLNTELGPTLAGMALIYSFTTPDGVTHGEPDSEAEGTPSDGVLIGPDGPFAGQRLEVRYATMEGGPAMHPYVLESGKRLYPTVRVHRVLCPPGCTSGA